MVRIELAAEAPDAMDQLHGVEGVDSVQATTATSFRVTHRTDIDPRRELFQLAVARGWELVELHQETASLEDVFVRLTTRDQDDAAVAVHGEV